MACSHESSKHILQHCGGLAKDEELLILCDPSTEPLAKLFQKTGSSLEANCRVEILGSLDRHGQEPPAKIADLMAQSSLIVSLCTHSLAHSQARTDATQARFLSLPYYSWELLDEPALLVDYRSLLPTVKRIADAFTAGKTIHVKTGLGTNMKLDVQTRIGNCCPGFVTKPGDLGSPPDVEANISPVENRSEGLVVVDGSITCSELGLLTTPVYLTVEAGQVCKIESENKQYVSLLNNIFCESNSKRRILAECGVGLNPKAKLTGTMLTDEGALGCMHFGFGANASVGGMNKIDFHLDFVFNDATLVVDGETIIDNGVIVE